MQISKKTKLFKISKAEQETFQTHREQYKQYCFDVVRANLNHQPIPEWPVHLPNLKIPIQVNFYSEISSIQKPDKGSLEPQELKIALPKYTLESIENDHYIIYSIKYGTQHLWQVFLSTGKERIPHFTML